MKYAELRATVREFSKRDAWTAGREFFEPLTLAQPRDAGVRTGLGFFCLKETKYDTRRAASELAEALRVDPDFPLAHVYLAILFACLQDDPAARAAASKARACGACTADAVMAEAYVELDCGSLDKAVALFTRLTELEPDSTSHILLGQALSQAGKNEAALAAARKAATLDKDDFRAYAYEGVYLSYLKKLDEARRALEKSLKMNASYALTHHTLAFVAREQGKKGDAEKHLRESLARDPYYVCSRQWLAELLAESGRKDEAREHYRTAIKQFPQWMDLRKALDALGSR